MRPVHSLPPLTGGFGCFHAHRWGNILWEENGLTFSSDHFYHNLNLDYMSAEDVGRALLYQESQILIENNLTFKRNAHGHLWRRLDAVRHGGKLKLNRHFIRSKVQSCVSRVSNLHTHVKQPMLQRCYTAGTVNLKFQLHLRLPYTCGRALVIWHWGVTDPQLLLFSVHQNATCVRDCFLPGSADTFPREMSPFLSSLREGRTPDFRTHFNLIGHPGDLVSI